MEVLELDQTQREILEQFEILTSTLKERGILDPNFSFFLPSETDGFTKLSQSSHIQEINQEAGIELMT